MPKITTILILCLGLLAGLLPGFGPVLAETPTLALPSGKARLMLVEIHADWCPRCHRVSPVFRQLAKEYARDKRVRFVVLDVTSKASKAASQKKAEDLKLADWYARNRSKTSMVGVFTLPDRNLIHTFANQADRAVYVDAITGALAVSAKHVKSD